MKNEDAILKSARARAKNFYRTSPQIKNSVLNDVSTGERICCPDCGAFKYKLYKKFGGLVFAKNSLKVIKNEETTFNFVCKCGSRLVIKEDKFKYGKLKFGCAAQKCLYGKTSMDKECLSCKYITEK